MAAGAAWLELSLETTREYYTHLCIDFLQTELGLCTGCYFPAVCFRGFNSIAQCACSCCTRSRCFFHGVLHLHARDGRMYVRVYSIHEATAKLPAKVCLFSVCQMTFCELYARNFVASSRATCMPVASVKCALRTRTMRRESTREESAGLFLAKKMKARAVVGREEKSVLSDPGSELRLGREEKKKKVPRG